MRIEKVEILNWMPFRGQHILDLPEGAIAVVARYGDDPRRSNRAGKTALLEAIEWGFYGVHRKRYDDDIISEGEEETRVWILLSDNTAVIRSRKRGKSTQLVVTEGGTGTTLKKQAAEKRLQELIGFDHSDYRATANFAQGDVEAIVSRTSGERRKVVSQWLELDAWNDVAATIRADAQRAVSELADLRKILEIFDEKDEVSEDDILADIKESKAALEKAQKELQDVKEQLKDASAAESVKRDRNRLQWLQDRRKKIGVELKKEAFPSKSLEDARSEAAKRKVVANQAEKELMSARTLAAGKFDGQCPVMWSQCPVADEVVANKAAAQQKCNRAKDDCTAANLKLHHADSVLGEYEARRRSADKLKNQFNSLTAEAKRLSQSLKEAPEVETDADALRNRQDVLMQSVAQESADLRDAQRDLEDFRENLRKVEETKAQILEAEHRARVCQLAAKAVGPTGIPSAIAEAALVTLEERVAALLSPTGLSVQFAWDRPAKGLEGSCSECGYGYRGQKDKSCPTCGSERKPKRSEELEILVSDGTKTPEDVRADSGGGKVLVASAIRLAAAAMLRERRGARCAWSAVDEPFGPLDAENRETLARSFAGMLGSVGLEQAFVVSHDAALLDALPGRIEVVRHEDHSTVEVVR